MYSKYKSALSGYYDCYGIPKTTQEIVRKTWFGINVQLSVLLTAYWKNYDIKKHNEIYAKGFEKIKEYAWSKLSASYWLWRICYDWWAKPIRDWNESENDEIDWDRLVRKFGDDVRKVECISCDWLIGYYVDRDYGYYLGEYGDKVCDLETSYVGSDTEYIWSANEQEGDICSGCAESIYSRGTRVKIYKGELRYNVTFNNDGFVYDVIACENAELFDEFKHIIYWLIDGKQSEEEQKQADDELFEIDLNISWSHYNNKIDNVKHRLIQLADKFDIPLFRLGCHQLRFWTNEESHDLFQAIACELEHDPEKTLDFEQIAKDYELEIIN